MIQRIQSIWLFLAAVAGFISLKISFFSGHRINDVSKTMVFVNGSYNFLLTIVTTIAASLSLMAIFLYKNRVLQLRINIVAIVLSLITILLYFWQKQDFIPEESNINLTAIVAICIPVFLFLALRGIWKDEQLVKSADRLR